MLAIIRCRCKCTIVEDTHILHFLFLNGISMGQNVSYHLWKGDWVKSFGKNNNMQHERVNITTATTTTTNQPNQISIYIWHIAHSFPLLSLLSMTLLLNSVVVVILFHFYQFGVVCGFCCCFFFFFCSLSLSVISCTKFFSHFIFIFGTCVCTLSCMYSCIFTLRLNLSIGWFFM